jgi:hypothetical protein
MTTTAGDPSLELDYPRAFATAVAPALKKTGKHFRYLHLTGATVERDQARALWVKSDARKVKVCHCFFIAVFERIMAAPLVAGTDSA